MPALLDVVQMSLVMFSFTVFSSSKSSSKEVCVFYWDDLVQQHEKLPLEDKSLEHLLSVVPEQNTFLN